MISSELQFEIYMYLHSDVWNLFPHIKGGTQADDVQEYGAKGDIWVLEGGSDNTGEMCVLRSFMIFFNHYKIFR